MRHLALFTPAALLSLTVWNMPTAPAGVPGAALRLGLALGLAVAASGEVSALTLAFGSLGALGATALAPVSPALAGAVLLGGAFAERTLRVRRPSLGALHLGLALAAGAAAFALDHHLATRAIELRATALLVTLALASLPLLVAADDPAVHLLSLAADRSRDDVRAALSEAASLRRMRGRRLLGRAERQPWTQLLELVRERLNLDITSPRVEAAGWRVAPGAAPDPEQAIAQRLDQAILAAVDDLRRTYATAATTAS